MEVMPEGKNFRLVQEDELPELLEYLSQHLPESLKFHQTLLTFLNDRVWDFYFYVSKDWPQEPVVLHFPGVTSPPNGELYASFSVFCPSASFDSLRLLQDEDVLLDWTRPLCLNFTPEPILERLRDFYCPALGTMDTVCGDVYIAEQETEAAAAHIEALPPLAPEVELRQLRREHARAIHDLYPANDMEAIEAFEKCIEALPAYGIFVKSTAEIPEKIDAELVDHIPAAWMVQSYYGAMFSMQTLPEFRRKGYGILLASRLTAAVRQRGYIPFVVIRPENAASQSLYLKLGFKKHYSTIRAVLKPNKIMYSEILLPNGANNMNKSCSKQQQNGGTKSNGCSCKKNDINDENGINDENDENIIKENGNLIGEVVDQNDA